MWAWVCVFYFDFFEIILFRFSCFAKVPKVQKVILVWFPNFSRATVLVFSFKFSFKKTGNKKLQTTNLTLKTKLCVSVFFFYV